MSTKFPTLKLQIVLNPLALHSFYFYIVCLYTVYLTVRRRFIDVTKSSRSEWMQMIPTSEKITKTAEDLEEPILKLVKTFGLYRVLSCDTVSI
jgi:hypothetical protein